MFVPVSCDARLYHLPYATVGLIIANTAAFGSMWAGIIDPFHGWVLMHGQGLHPVQWLLPTFMHADLGHLLGNLFFLWTFGLVIEGKLGWSRFLACYLVIGIGESAIEQVLMLRATPGPGSVGASAAIYGLLAMACVWAPMNEVKMLFMFGIVYFYLGTVDVSIWVLAALYVGLDVVVTLWLGLDSGGSFMHLIGAAIGAVLGLVLLKRKQVDCEHWDLFAVLRGEQGQQALPELIPLTADQVAELATRRAQQARQKILDYLSIGQAPLALEVVRRGRDLRLPLQLDRDAQLKLIVGLDQHKQWRDVAPLMANYIEQFPENSAAVRLRLAQICLVELERPARTLELLKPLALEELNAKQRVLCQQLARVARHRIAAGIMELDDVL